MRALISCVSTCSQVTKQKGYRSFVIALLPQLRVLDFKKVKLAERKEAQASNKRQRTADSAASSTPKTSVPAAEAAGSTPKAGPTPEQIAMIKAAIANASSLEEVAKLEKALKAGDYDAVLGAPEGEPPEGVAPMELAPAESASAESASAATSQ